MKRPANPLHVLIIPGLRGREAAHWQSWLQGQYRDVERVIRPDWTKPDPIAWSEQIALTIKRHDLGTRWIAVAHSFGCVALTHRLTSVRPGGPGGVVAALMVAPADPVKIQSEDRLPAHPLGIKTTLIGSENDPWMPLDPSRAWAGRWDARLHNLGQAGHINTASGFGPWPLARVMVDGLIRRAALDAPQDLGPRREASAPPGVATQRLNPVA